MVGRATKGNVMTGIGKRGAPLDDGFRSRPFVKAKQQLFPPHLWRWEIRAEGDEQPHQTSPYAYRSAHDAWEAGRDPLDRILR
jgi:hypothetical protein